MQNRYHFSASEKQLLAKYTLDGNPGLVVYPFSRIGEGENVLIEEGKRAVLCDFGMAGDIKEPSTHYVFDEEPIGTFLYGSKEMLLYGKPNTLADDIWALALVLQVAVTREPLFSYVQDERHFRREMRAGKIKINFTKEECARQPLVTKFSLWAGTLNRNERPTAEALKIEMENQQYFL